MSEVKQLSRFEDLLVEQKEKALEALNTWANEPFPYSADELYMEGPVILCEIFTHKVDVQTKSGLFIGIATGDGNLDAPEIVFPKAKVIKVSEEVLGPLSNLQPNQIVNIPHRYTVNKVNAEWKAWVQLKADTEKERPAPEMATPEPPRLIGFINDLDKYKYYHDYENLIPNLYLLPANLIIGYGKLNKV